MARKTGFWKKILVFICGPSLCFLLVMNLRSPVKKKELPLLVEKKELPSGISGEKHADCKNYQFSTRSKDSASTVMESWKKATTYVSKNKLTFLTTKMLTFHRNKLMEIEERGIPGMILECGVAKAGSSITFAAVKNHDRCLHLFDTFEGMPEPSKKDGKDVHDRYKNIQNGKKKCLAGEKCDKSYYGNIDNLLGFDRDQFERAGYPPEANNVFFHKGLFQDTVWPAGQVAYAHLDGDWYESTLGMLERIVPFLSDGGYIVLDDVFDWSGAKHAFVDYLNVDEGWLSKTETKNCLTERDGKRLLVFNDVKHGVKLLGQEEGTEVTSCPPKKGKRMT